jgi:hypothetical protein
LESGLPESRPVQDFVAGGPGDAGQIVRDNLTWGFGALRENEDLVRWIRDYDADSAHRRKVRFYGVDLSLGGPGGQTPTPIPLKAVLSYLVRVDPPSGQRARATLQPVVFLAVGLVLLAAFMPATAASLPVVIFAPLWLILPTVAVTLIRRGASRCDEQPASLLSFVAPARLPPRPRSRNNTFSRT